MYYFFHFCQTASSMWVGRKRGCIHSNYPHYSINLPIEFKQLQFPVAFSFAMSISKVQWHSLKTAGLNFYAFHIANILIHLITSPNMPIHLGGELNIHMLLLAMVRIFSSFFISTKYQKKSTCCRQEYLLSVLFLHTTSP